MVRGLIGFGVVPLVVFGLLAAVADYYVRMRHGAEVIEALGVAAAEQLDQYLSLHRGAILQVADRLGDSGSPLSVDRSPALSEALQRTRAAFPGFLSMLVADPAGIVIAGSPTRLPDGSVYAWTGVSVSDRRYFQAPVMTGRPFVSGVFVGRGFGRDLLCAASAPIVATDGTLLGVVQGAIELEALSRLMRAAASQPGLEMVIVDPAGNVAFATAGVPFAPPQSVRGEGWFDPSGHASARFIDRRLSNAPFGDTLAFEVDTADAWRVVTMTSRWHLLSRTLIDIGVLLLLATGVAFAALLLGRIYSRRIIDPLNKLGRRLDSLSLETGPSQLEGRSGERELALLEDAFARLAHRVDQGWNELQAKFATEARLRGELATSIAERQTIDAELSIAREIQMSMVPNPASLAAESPLLDLCAMLEPARAVGGDFYDVISVDAQYTCFYVGDVSDKGVAAALFMARVSTFLEVAARSGEPPGKMLSVVARQITRENPSEMFATVLCGVIDTGIGTLSLASAGHDPPLLLRADGRIECPPMETGPALGFDADGEYPQWHLRLRPGDAVLCYTDGLSEAADAQQREFGSSGIVEALKAAAGCSADGIMQELTRAVRAHLAGLPAHDDLTVLCLRRPGAVAVPASVTPAIELQMPNRLTVLPVLSAALDDALSAAGVPERVRMEVTLVLEEVLSNTVRHGYPGGARDTIRVSAQRDHDRLHLRFDDGAVEWNPLAHELPDIDLPLEERDVGGLGVMLVRELSESAHYERRNGRNQLSLVIRLDTTEELSD